MNLFLKILLILIPFISIGQSSNNSRSWSEKAKKEFYVKYNYQDKSEKDKKVIDCLFNKLSNKFSSLSQAESELKYLNKTMESCSLSVYIPITGQLTAQQEEIINQQVLNQMNNFRSQNNLSVLIIDPELEIVAKLQSDYNAVRKELSHSQSSNISYSTPVKRVSMVKTGNDKTLYSVGENATLSFIASDQEIDSNYLEEIAIELFETWKQSEGHRENMLNPNFKYYGFAVTVREESGIIYAIQVFTQEK